MKKILELNNQEDGYSLAGVLIIFIVATVLGMSIVALSVNSMNISNKEHDDQSAFYIAESGTTYRVAQVEKMVESATTETEQYIEDVVDGTIIDGTFDPENEGDIKDKFFALFDEKLNPGGTTYIEDYHNFELIKGEQPEAEITVEIDPSVAPADNPKTYNVVSEGVIGDESRLVHLPLSIEWHDKPEYAILTKEGINIIGKEIHGDIGTVNPAAEVVVFPGGNPVINGDIFVPNGDPNAIKIEAAHLNGVIPMPPMAIDDDTDIPNLPDFPSYPILPVRSNIVGDWNAPKEIVINSDGSYQKISIPSGMTYTFHTGSQDRNIVVDELNIDGNLKINGTGKLNIYVKDKFHTGYSMGSSSSIGSSTQINDINIYFAGDIIRLAGNSKIYGSIFAEKAELDFGAGSGFMGNVLTGGSKVSIKGGSDIASQLILAPNADVIHSNGIVKGMIVSKTYSASGGAELHFDQSTSVDGPLSLDEVINHPNNVGNTFMQRPDPTFNKQSLREK